LNSLARGHRGLGLICALLLPSLVASPIVTWAAGSDEDLTKADWSVNAPHDLAHNPPSKDAVSRLIGLAPDNPSMGKVCDFHFADLRHQGTLSLVVSNDGGGESDCNDVDIYDKTPRGLEDRMLNIGAAYLDGVEDINGDGRFEVIVDGGAGRECMAECFSMNPFGYCYPCRTCTEYWPGVYAWTGSGYTEVSSQYPKYYERELESVKKQIAAIDAAQAAPTPMQSETTPQGFSGSAITKTYESGSKQLEQVVPQQIATPSPAPEAEEPPDPSELDCLKAEAAKMERFLGTSKDAGMSDAIQWANSKDPMQREFATGFFRGLGTAEALKYEKTLRLDPDIRVAKSAKLELDSWREAETPDTFELESKVQIKPNAPAQGAK
jgi:hypothetical protein